MVSVCATLVRTTDRTVIVIITAAGGSLYVCVCSTRELDSCSTLNRSAFIRNDIYSVSIYGFKCHPRAFNMSVMNLVLRWRS